MTINARSLVPRPNLAQPLVVPRVDPPHLSMIDSSRALLDATRRWARLDAAQERAFAALFEVRTAATGDTVALPGDLRHEILFVAEGLLRFYYTGTEGEGAEGRESNKAFVVEGEFAGAVASAQLGVPILYGIEALETTTYCAAPYASFSALLDADPAFERIGRKLAETILARKERKARDLMLRSATERYLDLVEQRPDLVQRVPQRHLATYLGMTDVHLSRVRRQLAESASFPILNPG